MKSVSTRKSRAGSSKYPRWLRRAGAILGMILMIIVAIALVQQESGRLVRRTRSGHLYSPFLRELSQALDHRAPASREPTAGLSGRGSFRSTKAVVRDSHEGSGHAAETQ